MYIRILHVNLLIFVDAAAYSAPFLQAPPQPIAISVAVSGGDSSLHNIGSSSCFVGCVRVARFCGFRRRSSWWRGKAGAWSSQVVAMGWFMNLVVVMSCVAGGLVLYPVQIADNGKGEQAGVSVSGIIRLVHLLSFATAFGTSVWASFIGGIIMFKNLPRHQFGNLQAKMFPAYFKLLIVCCSLCVSAMATTHPWLSATKRERLQIVALGVSLFTVLINLLVFQPLTVKIMRQRHKIEKDEGIGTEVGWTKNVEAAKSNPELAKINKTFGMVHGFSSLANLFCFGGLAFHSWYIASRMLL